MIFRQISGAVLGVAIAWGQASPITPLARKVMETVSVDHAMESVRQVYSTDRWFTFPKFQETAEFLKTRLEKGGVQRVEIGAAPADGKSQAGFWTMPLAWDVKSARLDVISPARFSLCDYAITPTCLGMWSGASPGVDAELVDLDTTPWEQVRGKLVLTSQNSAGLKGKLVQHGALGAVNGFSENPELGNERQWINAWGDQGWGYLKTSTPLLSYSVTPNQAKRLRDLLAKQKVKVRAKAETRFYEGAYPWVTGLIPGETDDEVLALAHTSEQGAQDNATGVAASMEALFTLQKLIAAGKLAKPRRGIRVLLMPEMYGSLSYITKNPERMRRTFSAITVDTPAASYDLAGTEYTIYKNPHVAKSWTDSLMQRVTRAVVPRRRPFHTAEYTTGTDAYLGEQTIGVPTVWPYSGTGTVTHHNSADTPDTVDRRSLGDLTAMVATFLYYAANAGDPEMPWLASLVIDSAAEDFNAAASAGMDALLAGDKAAGSFALARLAYLSDRYREALNRLPVWRPLPPTQAARLVEAGAQVYSRPPSADGSLVVKRKRIGTIPLDDLPQAQWEGFPSGAWDKLVTVALYWCDGKRSLDEVSRLTEMEMGRPLTFPFGPYFRFLERHGYVDFVK